MQPEKLLSMCPEKRNLIAGRVFGLFLNAALMLFSILTNFPGENVCVLHISIIPKGQISLRTQYGCTCCKKDMCVQCVFVAKSLL